ncbi:MAG: hypothetical protein IH988_11780 [Planctomycetes bacterium]|nr:hypothetical protein [Planctomycetota bacterium]
MVVEELTEALLSDVGLVSGLGDVEGLVCSPQPQMLPLLIAGTLALVGWRGVHIWK